MELPLYGIMAEFEQPDQVLNAAKSAYAAGYRRMDAYSPLPIHGLSEALGFRATKLPMIVLIGGILGCLGGFGLQYWASVINYPIIIGGKPMNSWPSFIPVTFECTVLLAALSAVFGMLALNGLPQPYHPVFNVDRFERATRDRFFLCIEARDKKFDRVDTRKFLESLPSCEVTEVTV
jgi:hypothetical protein